MSRPACSVLRLGVAVVAARGLVRLVGRGPSPCAAALLALAGRLLAAAASRARGLGLLDGGAAACASRRRCGRASAPGRSAGTASSRRAGSPRAATRGPARAAVRAEAACSTASCRAAAASAWALREPSSLGLEPLRRARGWPASAASQVALALERLREVVAALAEARQDRQRRGRSPRGGRSVCRARLDQRGGVGRVARRGSSRSRSRSPSWRSHSLSFSSCERGRAQRRGHVADGCSRRGRSGRAASGGGRPPCAGRPPSGSSWSVCFSRSRFWALICSSAWWISPRRTTISLSRGSTSRSSRSRSAACSMAADSREQVAGLLVALPRGARARCWRSCQARAWYSSAWRRSTSARPAWRTASASSMRSFASWISSGRTTGSAASRRASDFRLASWVLRSSSALLEQLAEAVEIDDAREHLAPALGLAVEQLLGLALEQQHAGGERLVVQADVVA